jgi:nitrite reductase (NADH) small subunit/3-phenylpropionate/trans-cinnamate dioxygenase ferredoxin subunit
MASIPSPAVTEPEPAYTRVADVAEIREGRGHGVYLGGVRVALFRKGMDYYAVADRCPHMGASLSDGNFSRGMVQCSWHNWRFDVQTGRCEQKAWAKLALYDVRVEGSDVLVRPRPAATVAADAGPDEDEAWMRWQPPADDEPSSS